MLILDKSSGTAVQFHKGPDNTVRVLVRTTTKHAEGDLILNARQVVHICAALRTASRDIKAKYYRTHHSSEHVLVKRELVDPITISFNVPTHPGHPGTAYWSHDIDILPSEIESVIADLLDLCGGELIDDETEDYQA